MKKVLATALACLMTLSVGTSCVLVSGKYNVNGLNVPTYTHDDKIDITAYAGPTIENWSGSSRNVNTITDEHYQKLADAGFTKVLALYEGGKFTGSSDPFKTIANKSKRATEDALRSLACAEKVGVKYYVRDWNFYGFSREMESLGITSEQYEQVIAQIFGEDNEYINHPAYAGNFAFDEPSYEELEFIAQQVELYKKYVPNGEPYINLYPSYVSGAALGGATYSDYLDKYFETIAPQVGYVSYDFYPFKKDKYTGSAMKTGYLHSLETMAVRCKQTRETEGTLPIELRAFIQTVGDFTGLRSMSNIGDFRLQIYSALAFGAREITYYKYVDENGSNADSDWALLNYMDGTYTWAYDCASKVNNEVHAFEDVYLNFEWQGSMYYNADPMVDNQNFANMVYAVSSEDTENMHPRIKKLEGTQDTLLTSFKDKDGNDAFMLVNFTDPYFQKDNQVTIKFKGAKGLLMYRNGQKMIVPLGVDGTYTFNLYPGEGRFIIPLN